MFFPLGAAVHQGMFAIVGHEDIPERCRPFPLFKDGIEDTKTGRVSVWWLWDGEREWRVGELTPDQYNLPIRATLNDTMLIQRIVEGWSPADEV